MALAASSLNGGGARRSVQGFANWHDESAHADFSQPSVADLMAGWLVQDVISGFDDLPSLALCGICLHNMNQRVLSR
jgi:hypothetical protein